ncbi:protein bicaudal D homolog [Nevskia soli]|uniref:protein bicaudal D homolog n=1 Tax=Nevskia soli TaxID=418856 RepID=UPI001FDFB1BC|nr:protein bicaudal D homolog [Nevskia soli]
MALLSHDAGGKPVRAASGANATLYCNESTAGLSMLHKELAQLDERVQRLIAAYRQARLERKRALQERDRLLALNAELKRRIEGVVERIRLLESDQAQ